MTTDKYSDVQAEQLRVICRRYEARCRKMEKALNIVADQDCCCDLNNSTSTHDLCDACVAQESLAE